ncbi:MAG: hypothetical protein ACJAVI_006129 [Candidatus Azotimanducaceae bacterium]|jgi:hypothetical protein
MTNQAKNRHISLTDRLTALKEAIEAGSLKKAVKMHQTLLKELDIARSPPALSSTGLAEVDAVEEEAISQLKAELAEISAALPATQIKLNELKDWQGFATNPKRVDLCEAMTKLHEDAEMDLQFKAEQIRQLQKQWKKLGASDSRDAQRLWKKFKALSDVAYAPCNAFFDGLQERRELNLQRQREIIDSLEYYLTNNDWANTNWNAASNILQQAKTEWRQFQDVPRNKKRRTDQRFNKVFTQLLAKQKDEQHANYQKKQDLSQKLADAIANHQDGSSGHLEKLAKQMQREWKQVGITLRKEDQKLWLQFRALCDQVFAIREVKNHDQAQQTAVYNQQLEVLVLNLESLVDQGNIGIKQLRALSNEFEAAKQLNKNTGINAKFQQVKRRAEAAIKQQQKDQDKHAVIELQHLSHLCDQLEQGALTVESFDEQWHQSDLPEKHWLHAIEQRRNHLLTSRDKASQATTPSTDSGALDEETAKYSQVALETRRQQLCAQIEILAGLDSPESAAKIRMQLQIERLQRGLSRGERDERDVETQLQALQIVWYSLGHLALAEASSCNRFKAAEKALGF